MKEMDMLLIESDLLLRRSYWLKKCNRTAMLS